MKKVHLPSLKFHTIYSSILAIVFVITLIIVPDFMLGIALGILLAYVIGNGIIHGKKNELTRDAIVEYILLSVIIGLLVAGAIFTR